MERNRWETAIRCLEIAVHPHTRDDEVVAAINGFRRTADGAPVSQVCIEFACGGLPLAELATMKATLERLDRENRELRRRLAVEEVAQQEAAQRLDDAYRRIYELTEEAAANERLTQALEQEFDGFRAAYSQAIDSARAANADLRGVIDEALRATGEQAATKPHRPFSALLAEARLGVNETASFAGTGSGRKTASEPSWSA